MIFFNCSQIEWQLQWRIIRKTFRIYLVPKTAYTDSNSLWQNFQGAQHMWTPHACHQEFCHLKLPCQNRHINQKIYTFIIENILKIATQTEFKLLQISIIRKKFIFTYPYIKIPDKNYVMAVRQHITYIAEILSN